MNQFGSRTRSRELRGDQDRDPSRDSFPRGTCLPFRRRIVETLALLLAIGPTARPADASAKMHPVRLLHWIDTGELRYPYRVDFGGVRADTAYQARIPFRNTRPRLLYLRDLSPT